MIPEALEVSMLQETPAALSGGRLIRTPPYRAPHHGASMVSRGGGGLRVRPKEVGLPHRVMRVARTVADLAAATKCAGSTAPRRSATGGGRPEAEGSDSRLKLSA
ncbi:MAG TPA: ATP-binding protein [Allosphingosinicella sp.]|nr:ATP-binding protein [Allosphingosinicella sp.]